MPDQIRFRKPKPMFAKEWNAFAESHYEDLHLDIPSFRSPEPDWRKRHCKLERCLGDPTPPWDWTLSLTHELHCLRMLVSLSISLQYFVHQLQCRYNPYHHKSKTLHFCTAQVIHSSCQLHPMTLLDLGYCQLPSGHKTQRPRELLLSLES